ncbi:unnamed protein product [Pleuronectes platessa]|uniref:Uncharacterized protein n=1 Tax=Pleuronectes platessa TaxID=8262 RepID=A0A9N7V3T9_PLEPL|nr:unnamed protein product [Pleuronectes platessa]
MGRIGGESGNELGHLSVSVPPEPDSLFLLVALQRAFSQSVLPSPPSSPPPVLTKSWTSSQESSSTSDGVLHGSPLQQLTKEKRQKIQHQDIRALLQSRGGTRTNISQW